jgi:hypothetical protein
VRKRIVESHPPGGHGLPPPLPQLKIVLFHVGREGVNIADGRTAQVIARRKRSAVSFMSVADVDWDISHLGSFGVS